MVAVYYCELHTMRTTVHNGIHQHGLVARIWIIVALLNIFIYSSNHPPKHILAYRSSHENEIGFNFCEKAKLTGKLNENYFGLHSRESDLNHNGQRTRWN